MEDKDHKLNAENAHGIFYIIHVLYICKCEVEHRSWGLEEGVRVSFQPKSIPLPPPRARVMKFMQAPA